ncbi:hypothetical protein H4R20_002672 [Coemansia guatemalensis]|uniref:PB1 domain-containing protein n=1 Tax=Coemansia guatemalensis TaxID=2761395 RepID=A0A9W8LTD3_9FUNG|nr:hypothetical protein H4R20_002672 [Coemansia guatemalensis]
MSMATTSMTTDEVREEQRVRVLQSGGRVLKFTNNGGKLYFRYFFPHPETLTWNKLTSGLRVLFSIASTDLYIRYTDIDGSKITVNDNNGLQIMFDETKSSDVIRIEVISEGTPLAVPSGPVSSSSTAPQATMQMPMPPSGFPGMELSRPQSAMSNMTGAGHMNQQGQAMGPPGNPGPVPHTMQQPMSAGPVPGGSHGYGPVNNASLSTLPPPRPQQPLD